MGTLRVHERSFSYAAAIYLAGSSVAIDIQLRPLTHRSNHPVSLAFSSSRKRRPKPPLPVSPKIVSDAWQGRNLPWSSRLRNPASRHGFTPNDFTFHFNVPREPDHATLWRPAPSVFQSSTGEVRYLRVYLCFPLAAKRTGVPVPLYEALPKRRTAANLAASGWIACSVQVVVPPDELRR